MNLWSIEKDSEFNGYFVWRGTTAEPLRNLQTHTITLWGAKFWIWRHAKQKPPLNRSVIVFQVAK
jgi:hypothetical protein